MSAAAPETIRLGLFLVVILFCGAVQPSNATEQPTAPCSAVLTLSEAAAVLRVDLQALERLAEAGGIPGRRIGDEWRFDCAALMAWLQVSAVTGRGVGRSQEQTGDSTSPAAQESPIASIGEAPQERTAEDVFLRGNRVLLGRGDVVIDVGQFYARSDAVQLLGVDGVVGLGVAEQSALTTLLVARVGILRETELFASTSFSRQNHRELFGDITISGSHHSAFGSTGVGFRRTLLREGRGRPDVVASVSGQLPTGDALPAVAGGLIIVKSVDPVVLFASANYSHPFTKSSDGGRVTPVDSVDVSMGYGLGLNDTLAISMAVGGLFSGRITTDTGPFRRPSAFSVRFGLTTWLAQGLYLEPSISFGVSGPGRPFAIGVTMPYAF